MASARKKLNILRKLAAAKFNEAEHPRYPKGDLRGGQFVAKAERATKHPGCSSRDCSRDESTKSIRLKYHPNIEPPLGRKTTTLLELSAIGADSSGHLTYTELCRLDLIRNRKRSFEEFLKSPPDLRDMAFLFYGNRVKMTVTGGGSVAFSVDHGFTVDDRMERKVKPSQELIEMEQIFQEYLKSRAGQRVLSCVPILDDKDRFNMRVKHYKKSGFITLWEIPEIKQHMDRYGSITAAYPMVFDNRPNPDSFIHVIDYPDVMVKGNLWKFDWQYDEEATKFPTNNHEKTR